MPTTDPTARIAAALAHWRKTVDDIGTVYMLPPDTPDATMLTLQRLMFATGPLAAAVEDELPALIARLAAADALIAVVRDILPDADYYDYSRADLITALAAYDRVVGSADAQGDGG